MSKANQRFTPLDTYCIGYILFHKFNFLDKLLIPKGFLSNGGARENIRYQKVKRYFVASPLCSLNFVKDKWFLSPLLCSYLKLDWMCWMLFKPLNRKWPDFLTPNLFSVSLPLLLYTVIPIFSLSKWILLRGILCNLQKLESSQSF